MEQQSRFQGMSDTIITRIDSMGKRIDDLEQSIANLMQQVRRMGGWLLACRGLEPHPCERALGCELWDLVERIVIHVFVCISPYAELCENVFVHLQQAGVDESAASAVQGQSHP